MRALTGLEERVSYVRFWLELLREVGGRRVGGFSEPVTATRSPQSSTGLLSLSSVLPPSRPHSLSFFLGGGVGTKSDLRAVKIVCFQFSFCLFFDPYSWITHKCKKKNQYHSAITKRWGQCGAVIWKSFMQLFNKYINNGKILVMNHCNRKQLHL